MKFVPKTEKELKGMNLLQDGDYNFDVLTATDEISKKSNSMIKVKLGIYRDIEGTADFRIFDYLLPQLESKLRHFCDSTGLLSEYESGQLTADMCTGRSGKCRITLKDDATYGLQNKVKDYVCRPAKPLSTQTGENRQSEDIPF